MWQKLWDLEHIIKGVFCVWCAKCVKYLAFDTFGTSTMDALIWLERIPSYNTTCKEEEEEIWENRGRIMSERKYGGKGVGWKLLS